MARTPITRGTAGSRKKPIPTSGTVSGGGRPATICLSEDVYRNESPLKVDREKKIIFGVKILGLESANGRRYTLEAIRDAKALYDGVLVNVDHPSKPTEGRSSYDRFGWLENVTVKADGLYGDLHYLDSHAMASTILEAAERNPRLFGLSHNAQGEGETDTSGIFIVQKITEVRHVDLVADPATTKSLSESRKAVMKKSIRSVMEAALPKLVPAWKQKVLVNFFEMADEKEDLKKPLEAEMDMPAEPIDSDPMAALKDGFDAAIMAVLQDDSMDASAKIKRIGDLLKTHEKLTAAAAPVEEEDEDEEDIEEGGSDKLRGKNQKGQLAAINAKDPQDWADSKKHKADPALAQLQEQLKTLERKDRARELCEAAGFLPSKALLKALCLLPNDADCKALIEETKKTQAPSRPNAPRSQSPGVYQPAGANDKPLKFPTNLEEARKVLASN